MACTSCWSASDTDGNPATTADPTWLPLLTTPPYPDYVSGYSAVPNATRHYDSGKALDQDVINARVWLGIHFRFADTRGVDMGHHVADWALDHRFQRVEEREER